MYLHWWVVRGDGILQLTFFFWAPKSSSTYSAYFVALHMVHMCQMVCVLTNTIQAKWYVVYHGDNGDINQVGEK